MHSQHRDVASVGLPQRVIERLKKTGFNSTHDLQDFVGKPHELAAELGVVVTIAQDILKVAFSGVSSAESSQQSVTSSQPIGSSVLEMLKNGPSAKIITMSQSIDSMLGGGISVGELTELCGLPGIGKTQICMQLSLNVQIPSFLKGMEGDAIYIDTEGSFSPHRIHEMAMHLVKQLHTVTSKLNPENASLLPDVRTLLSRIQVFRVHDHIEQMALIRALPSILDELEQQNKRRVKLIVIDSVAFHFRYRTEDIAQRTRQLHALAQQLSALCKKHGIATVLVNQVSTETYNRDWHMTKHVFCAGDHTTGFGRWRSPNCPSTGGNLGTYLHQSCCSILESITTACSFGKVFPSETGNCLLRRDGSWCSRSEDNTETTTIPFANRSGLKLFLYIFLCTFVSQWLKMILKIKIKNIYSVSNYTPPQHAPGYCSTKTGV
jgi:RAD51-like protein 2